MHPRAVLPMLVLGLAFLSGCRSIPTLVPDMRWRSGRALHLEDGQGPLSAAQSQQVLAKLKSKGTDTNIYDRHLAIEQEIVGSPLVVGNKVEILVDGPTTYQAMFKAMDQARDSINVETFTFENDEVGRHFAEILLRKQKQGVQVNLLYDSVGSISTPKAFFEPLEKSGANILEFNPINPLKLRRGWAFNRRDHRKLTIVDGEVAFVGGINISSVYSSGSFGRVQPKKGAQPWRDTHLRMAGPIVGEFQKLFMASWEDQKGKTLAPRAYFPTLAKQGPEVVRAIGSTPKDPYCQIYATLISAIDNAESQVLITNAYFVPDPRLLAALKNAVKRGVDVRLLLPDKTDSVLVYNASRSYFHELLKAGVKIYKREGEFLHAKTAVVDGLWSTIGSTNLDWRSFTNNQEINAVVLGQGFGAQMQAMYFKDLEASKPITLEMWKRRSLLTRLKQHAARLWARLL
jgi:cardiolipin synthase A/B